LQRIELPKGQVFQYEYLQKINYHLFTKNSAHSNDKGVYFSID